MILDFDKPLPQVRNAPFRRMMTVILALIMLPAAVVLGAFCGAVDGADTALGALRDCWQGESSDT